MSEKFIYRIYTSSDKEENVSLSNKTKFSSVEDGLVELLFQPHILCLLLVHRNLVPALSQPAFKIFGVKVSGQSDLTHQS